jgi:hypothetical protein
MARLLLSLSALATTLGIAAVGVPAPQVSSARTVPVIGRERPLFLGSAIVTASALPGAR